MFREMRRFRQALSRAESEDILRRGTSGVLAVSGDGGYPYAVPLSYVYDGGEILFHSACAGHKLDALRRCDKASFCVIDRDEVVPETFTTYFRSAIAFGRVRELTDGEEKRAALMRLAVRYAPEAAEARRQAEVEQSLGHVTLLALTVEHLSGKQAIELTPGR